MREARDLISSAGRSPYGERGLKYVQIERRTGGFASLSLRRAWIEMIVTVVGSVGFRRSPYGERGLK